MSKRSLKHYSDWIPAAVVLVVVLVAGSRLVALSLQQHAAQEREAAQAVVGRYGRAIQSQLRGLMVLAQREAARAAGTAGNAFAQGQRAAENPARSTFSIASDGRLLQSPKVDAAIVQSIALEWKTADAHEGSAAAELLGPIRQGSQWIVAARVPIDLPDGSGVAQHAGWGISFRPLHQLLSSAKVGELVKAGYDFELSQFEPTYRRSRIFTGTRTTPLSDSVTRAIDVPSGLSRSVSGNFLSLAIRPRAGWYPAAQVAAQISLLVVIAWLLTLGARDLARTSSRLRLALAVGKGRMRLLNQRLLSEIEQRTSLQKSFEHARYHDAFTGLPNRRYFMDQLDRALRQVRSRRQRVAVVLVDIDRFKIINEILGHTAGDEVMVQIARRFEKAAVALECVLARWGGDQFALLLFDVHSSDTAIAMARLLQDALREPFSLRKHRLTVAARVGVTCVDSGLKRVEDVLREADIALSAAKTHESARAIAYDPTMIGDVVSLVSLEADLHLALERDEFQLLFQPIVNLHSLQVVGAETLLRWQHPLEGLLTPDRFLVIAEEAGVTVPVTRWIILRACRMADEWRRREPSGAERFISVNLSASALRDPGLVEFVADALRKTHASPASLRFELTEDCLISNVGAAREILGRLHAMGIQLMLDDFGTGYSSLSYLQLFPFDYVKIDRPHVGRSGQSTADSGVTGAMVQMATSLGLKAIAEKVESQAAVDALRLMGCEFGQGRFFGEPAEARDVMKGLRKPSADEVPTLVEPAPVVGAAAAGATPLVETMLLAQPGDPNDDADTLLETMVKPNNPNDDAATLVETMELAKPGDSNDDAATLVETVVQAKSVPPLEESGLWVAPPRPSEPNAKPRALTETVILETGIDKTDDSPTLAEPPASAPSENSATLSETMELATTIGLDDDSPTLRLRRRTSRAG